MAIYCGIYYKLESMFSFDKNTLISRIGDEFLIYSPDCTEEQETTVAKQIKSITSIMGRSISFGAVNIRSETDNNDISKLITLADSRMQKDKNETYIENLKKISPHHEGFVDGVMSSLLNKLHLRIENLTEAQLKEFPNKIIEVLENYSEEPKASTSPVENLLSKYSTILADTQQKYGQVYDDETISKIAKLKYLSTSDNGIYSHDAFLKAHSDYLDDRYTTLTLITIPLLKEINDTRGHEFADTEISELTNTLSEAFKDTDSPFIVKKSGSEFYVVSSKLTPEQLKKICGDLTEYNSKHELYAHILVDENDSPIGNNLFKLLEENEHELEVEKSQYQYSNLKKCGNTIVKMLSILDIHRPYDDKIIVKLKESLSRVIAEVTKPKDFTSDEDLPIKDEPIIEK